MITVSRLSTSAVKSLRLSHPDRIRLEPFGVADNRRFVLLTPDGELLDARRHGRLMTIESECDDAGDHLKLRLPDGRTMSDAVSLVGDAFEMDMWGRRLCVRDVAGPWSAALSDVVGAPVRLVRTERPGEGNDEYPVSIVSLESVAEISRRGGRDDTVDPGRFRMLIELDGCRPHQEDEWIGRRVRVGGAIVAVAQPDDRCAITTMNPTSGEVDFPALKVLAGYRRRPGRRLPFGMYADVAVPGDVRVGDAVEILE
jgi:uncharacterized protein